MPLKFDLPKQDESIIKVIGVGGGGSNAVNYMFREGIKGVEFVICNTDNQALDMSPVPSKIQLGSALTEGRGAGSSPEVGRNAAMENIDDLKKILSENTKMVFITAGMGGGTGTGAAPVIAKTAKEMGILTVGIVTTPFGFEGRKRKNVAYDGIESLKENVDTLLVISNEKLREVYGNLSISSAFSHADNILSTAAKGIAEIITVPGYINVDFEDVKTVMSNSGVAIMGSATAEGEERARVAVENAIHSPLLDENDIQGAKYILLNITSGTKEILMDEISIITDYIQDAAGSDADMIWGTCHDDSLGDKISVTIIATGFDGAEVKVKNTQKIVRQLDNPDVAEVQHKIKKEEKPAPYTQMNLFERKNTANSSETNPPMANPSPSNHEEDGSSGYQEDRVKRLQRLSYSVNNQKDFSDIEQEPAFKRKNVKLMKLTPSSETDISRYALTDDKEDKPEIKPNNGYLHDNVD